MSKIVDSYGRPFNALDELKARVALQGRHEGRFVVLSADGEPMFGTYMPDKRGEVFIATQWRKG